jgi:hypothetical protein
MVVAPIVWTNPPDSPARTDRPYPLDGEPIVGIGGLAALIFGFLSFG